MSLERLEALRGWMKKYNIDAYVVPTADSHNSEYVGEHFACREYLTGFTGSAGTALVLKDWAGLWTDGRYFVQAEKELAGSGFVLMRMGAPDVPSIKQFLADRMPERGVLGFDGNVITAAFAEELDKILTKKQGAVCSSFDLVGKIWGNRPAMSAQPVWILEECYAGESAESKLARLRSAMQDNGATVHVLTTLDDIVWLLNLRGNDIPCNMTALSYLVVTKNDAKLFIQQKAVSEEVAGYLSKLQVDVCPYADIQNALGCLKQEQVLLEKQEVSYALYLTAAAQNKIIDGMNPTSNMKAVKNETELKNLRTAHQKDGIAMVHFLYWLKKHVGTRRITEAEAAEHLDSLRKAQGALNVSFETISAYGANAAMCHYHADSESSASLEPKGLYLVDSGGQYYEGTTDITRTVALGPISREEREHFTLVLMSMLRLGNAKFPKNCCNLTLDYAARELFWQRGMDFNHGTGHGVGYLSNVHERPVAIRSRYLPGVTTGFLFEPGMVCSDEPGLYFEGKYGIRTENMMVCVPTDIGWEEQFYGFEFLTLVPIDLEAVEPSLMEKRDKDALNRYHRQVYETLSPYLSGDELEWFTYATRKLT